MVVVLCPNANMLAKLRRVVSKKKRRNTEYGFNLDLSYVTPRLIAMGVPAEGFESVYRNPSSEVHRFLELRHKGHYKVYNLCSEYAPSKEFLADQLERFPFDDHNPSPLEMISLFCKNVQEYLESDGDNIIAVHCKAGKGRTGMMLAAALLHLGICTTADEALGKFADERTYNSRGVTIPSQIRYVHYYESVLQQSPHHSPHAPKYRLARVVLYSPPVSRLSFSGGGSRATFKLQRLEGAGRDWMLVDVYRYKAAAKDGDRTPKAGETLELACLGHKPLVTGDVKLKLYVLEAGEKRRRCHVWFNTGFVADGGMLHFARHEIDRACKDRKFKRFPEGFAVRVYLDPCGPSDDDGCPHLSLLAMDSMRSVQSDDCDTDSSGSDRDDDDVGAQESSVCS